MEILDTIIPFSISIVKILDFLSPKNIVFGIFGSVNGDESINVFIGTSIFYMNDLNKAIKIRNNFRGILKIVIKINI